MNFLRFLLSPNKVDSSVWCMQAVVRSFILSQFRRVHHNMKNRFFLHANTMLRFIIFSRFDNALCCDCHYLFHAHFSRARSFHACMRLFRVNRIELNRLKSIKPEMVKANPRNAIIYFNIVSPEFYFKLAQR